MSEIARITEIEAAAYRIPTDSPESDGTLEWNSTTLVAAHVAAGGQRGCGYTYADETAAHLINAQFRELLIGSNAMDVPGANLRMRSAIRNMGAPGIAATAISAVDNAMWDLKGKLLGTSLLDLLGAARDSALVYGSGGFTSYSNEQLQTQFSNWVSEGFSMVKMKIGRDAAADVGRVQAARYAIGLDVALAVDANGAYSPREALEHAARFVEPDVCWFEEPVSSDDLAGLRFVREHAPAGMHVAAGEYGYTPKYFQQMLAAGAVDVLQADATRCLGITGFLKAAALAEAFHTHFSFHCAPSLHAAVACAVPLFWIGEYFHDHARIEQMLFDGALKHVGGKLHPDRSRPGLGLELKVKDAARFAL